MKDLVSSQCHVAKNESSYSFMSMQRLYKLQKLNYFTVRTEIILVCFFVHKKSLNHKRLMSLQGINLKNQKSITDSMKLLVKPCDQRAESVREWGGARKQPKKQARQE